jgi:hypothetical protein
LNYFSLYFFLYIYVVTFGWTLSARTSFYQEEPHFNHAKMNIKHALKMTTLFCTIFEFLYYFKTYVFELNCIFLKKLEQVDVIRQDPKRMLGFWFELKNMMLISFGPILFLTWIFFYTWIVSKITCEGCV